MNGTFYCRLHEVEHLRVTPEAEHLNLLRLGTNLIADPKGCWLWHTSNNTGNYGTFVPEGANVAKWLTHRVLWDLLIGGHKPGLELDHRTCKQPACANPLHLEAVTRSINQRRKRQGPDHSWRNPEALASPKVLTFAATFGLPLKAQLPPVVSSKKPCTPKVQGPCTADVPVMDHRLVKSGPRHLSRS